MREVGHSTAPGADVRISGAIHLLPPYSFMVWTDTILPSLFIFVPSIRLSWRTGQLCVCTVTSLRAEDSGKRFYCSLKRPHRPWGPGSLPFNKYQGPSLWRNVAVGVNVISYSHHVPRVRLH